MVEMALSELDVCLCVALLHVAASLAVMLMVNCCVVLWLNIISECRLNKCGYRISC